MLTILLTHSADVSRTQVAGFITSVINRYRNIDNIRFVMGYNIFNTDIWFMCDESVRAVGVHQLLELGIEGEMDYVANKVKTGEWLVCYFGASITINLLQVFGGTDNIAFFEEDGVLNGTILPKYRKTSCWTPKCLLKLLS